ncbi:MAG: hypothetical protein LAO78_26760 [Acidobacteriia bacterium]|nr:hypothetical protein [Terriglobia bacterium]
MKRTFLLGKLVATPAALAACEANGKNPFKFIFRHAKGDWGDLSVEDIRANERAAEDGSRLLSAYHLRDGTKIWVITEADRSSTCILLPEEY